MLQRQNSWLVLGSALYWLAVIGPISLYHYYDIFAPEYDSAVFWSTTLNLCESGIFPISPSFLSIFACSLLKVFNNNLEIVFWVNSIALTSLIAFIARSTFRLLNVPYASLLSLLVIYNPGFMLQNFIFELEHMWHAMVWMFAFFFIRRNKLKLISVSSLIPIVLVFLACLESRPAEALMVTPVVSFFSLVSSSNKSWRVWLSAGIPWLVPVYVIGTLFLTKSWSGSDWAILTVQAITVAGAWWIAGGRARALNELNSALALLSVVWISIRIDDHAYWLVENINTVTQGGYYINYIWDRGMLTYTLYLIFGKLMWSTLVPMLAFLSIAFWSNMKKVKIQWSLVITFVAPLIVTLVFLNFKGFHSPHYLSGQASMFWIALMSLAGGVVFSSRKKYLAVGALGVGLLLQFQILSEQAFEKNPLGQVFRISGFYTTPYMRVWNTKGEVPAYLFENFPLEWYDEDDSLDLLDFRELLRGAQPERHHLYAEGIHVNLFVKKRLESVSAFVNNQSFRESVEARLSDKIIIWPRYYPLKGKWRDKYHDLAKQARDLLEKYGYKLDHELLSREEPWVGGTTKGWLYSRSGDE